MYANHVKLNILPHQGDWVEKPSVFWLGGSLASSYPQTRFLTPIGILLCKFPNPNPNFNSNQGDGLEMPSVFWVGGHVGSSYPRQGFRYLLEYCCVTFRWWLTNDFPSTKEAETYTSLLLLDLYHSLTYGFPDISSDIYLTLVAMPFQSSICHCFVISTPSIVCHIWKGCT